MLRRVLGIGLLVLVVAAGCGGADADGPTSAPAAAGGADVPGAGFVFFGTGYDPATFAIIGRSSSLKRGSPIVAVGRALTPRPASEVTVTLSSNGQALAPRPVTASNSPDNADIFVADLTADNLGTGTWVVNFVNPSGRILMAGYLSIAP